MLNRKTAPPLITAAKAKEETERKEEKKDTSKEDGKVEKKEVKAEEEFNDPDDYWYQWQSQWPQQNQNTGKMTEEEKEWIKNIQKELEEEQIKRQKKLKKNARNREAAKKEYKERVQDITKKIAEENARRIKEEEEKKKKEEAKEKRKKDSDKLVDDWLAEHRAKAAELKDGAAGGGSIQHLLSYYQPFSRLEDKPENETITNETENKPEETLPEKTGILESAKILLSETSKWGSTKLESTKNLVKSAQESIIEHPFITGIVIVGTGIVTALAPSGYATYRIRKKLAEINGEYKRTVKEITEGGVELPEEKLAAAKEKRGEALIKLGEEQEQRLKWTKFFQRLFFKKTLIDMQNFNHFGSEELGQIRPLSELLITTDGSKEELEREEVQEEQEEDEGPVDEAAEQEELDELTKEREEIDTFLNAVETNIVDINNMPPGTMQEKMNNKAQLIKKINSICNKRMKRKNKKQRMNLQQNND
jgi:hypothetical protein